MNLTPRQRQVMDLAAQDLSHHEIADRLERASRVPNRDRPLEAIAYDYSIGFTPG